MKAGEIRTGLWAMAASGLLAACGGGANEGDPLPQPRATERTASVSSHGHSQRNKLPDFIAGNVRATDYDGVTDDLLTAGFGASGLVATVPTYVDATAPTAAELRRAAIWNNYRALVDMTAAGGYGVFYGPSVGIDGQPTGGEGKVAGTEFIAFSDDGSGRRNVTLMVQLPASFDPKKPCIITATASGSRGIYGAISTGEWGLKRGCAVAYTDKGTGGAPHDLMADTVPLIDGTRAPASVAAADKSAAFDAGLSDTDRVAFNAAKPYRFAFKHAHSGRNPEKDWGRFTLQAIEFAFWAINERHAQHGRKFKPGNTLVIASSISNGGGAAIAAAELDRDGLIDGVAVTEPAVELPAKLKVKVQRGNALVQTIGKPLIDFTTWSNLYQPCASMSTQLAGTPFQASYAFLFSVTGPNRCASLKAKGLLSADTPAAQADEALAKLRAYGWEAESDPLHASHAAFEIASAVSVTFANAYARASVADSLCGYSFAGIDALAAPGPLAAPAIAQMFATGNGVPPNSGVQLINDASVGGARRDIASLTPSTGLADLNIDGALCLRKLLDGNDANARRLQAGLDATRRDGDLHGKPALIVHGRADALLPVNHTSRPYTALNKRVEGRDSRLSYIEVTNAQHFDGFIGLPTVLPGYDSRYVSLHLYLFRALDAMYAHLAEHRPLPPSQVVRTVPRGGTPGSAPALTHANVPPIALAPAAADRITYSDNTLRVPD